MRLSEPVDRLLRERSPFVILFVALGIALALNLINYSVRANLFLFQLLPVCLAAWYGGKRVGWAVSAYSAASGCVVEALELRESLLTFDRIETFLARLVVFLVITELLSKLLESRHRQKMLTSFVVHDLRSPIASAITGLMTVEQNAQLDEIDREVIALALVSNQRALELVNTLLDVSKMESGKFECKPVFASIEQVVDQAFAQLALWARDSGVELKKEVGVSEGYLDPTITTRILVNLISNALKFSPPQSTIFVRVEEASPLMVRFAVVDQGPGIPAEYIHTIFDPFTQVKGTKGGTGIGLAFCRFGVQALGGKIWVESEVGRGTSVLFEIQQPAVKVPALIR